MSEQGETPAAVAPTPTSTVPAVPATAVGAGATTQATHQTNGTTTNGITTPTPPAPAAAAALASTTPAQNIQNSSVPATAELGIDGEIEPPVVRMRNTAPAAMANVNGSQQASVNGHAAVARGLELLAETEASQTNEEIKKLDTQLDHFNKYLDKFEKKNSELTERLSTMLQSQKEERLKRRASFMQREEELKAQQDSFEIQMRNMFAKCAQMRRQTAPALDGGVEDMLENSRRIREGSTEAPILETNGHEETEPAAATN